MKLQRPMNHLNPAAIKEGKTIFFWEVTVPDSGTASETL